MIGLGETTEKDKQVITAILTKSFNYDTSLYFGEGAEDGPPGYSDGTLVERLQKNNEAQSFLIMHRENTVGFISVNLDSRELLYFCLLPEYIGKGIGTQTWKKIEKNYGEKNWYLETPSYSLSNHHFYQKNGFHKISEKKYPNGARSYIFQK